MKKSAEAAAKRPAKKTAKPAKATKKKTTKTAKKRTSAAKKVARPAKKTTRAAKKPSQKASKKATRKGAQKATKRATRVATPAEASSASSNGATPVNEVARELAALALAQRQQGGKLKIRQREQLRRALTAAAPSMGWESLIATTSDPVAKAKRDLKKLVTRGTKVMSQDLSDRLADKKAELKELKKVASSLEKLAKKEDEFPSEVTYLHTARNGSSGFVTKTETVVLSEPSEAIDVAQKIEKRLDTWGKHRDQMLEVLKHEQKQLEEMKEEVSDFVDSSQRVLGEVVTTLY